MAYHLTIEDIAAALDEDFQKSRCILIYAPNTVGKTRLAQHLKERDPDGVVLYNSFVEDSFTWDNDRFVLNVNPDL